MKTLPTYPMIFLVLILSACSTAQIQTDWSKRKENADYQKERNLFKERLSGKDVCWQWGLLSFLSPQSPQPNPKCLYPASRFEIADGDAGVGQAVRQLEVMQVTPEGYLIRNLSSGGQLIFVHKTDQVGVVDGAYLDETHDWSLYEYVGPYSYQTALSTSKTVYGFKRISKTAYSDANKGLKVYSLYDEMLAELGLWRPLEKSLSTPNQ